MVRCALARRTVDPDKRPSAAIDADPSKMERSEITVRYPCGETIVVNERAPHRQRLWKLRAGWDVETKGGGGLRKLKVRPRVRDLPAPFALFTSD